VPLAALQAEIERRSKTLNKLIAQRDELDREIAQLRSLSGQAVAAAPAARGRRRRKRGSFKQTGEQMIMGMLAKGPATTGEINRAWKAEGRGGSADTTLGRLVREKKLKREKVKDGRGSRYNAA
jgi:hypothetical protein